MLIFHCGQGFKSQLIAGWVKSFARRIKNELKEIKETSQRVTALLEDKRGEIAAQREQEEEAEQRRADARSERPFDSGLAPCYCFKNGISTYVGMRTGAQCSGRC
jgi:hypothetical protein